jgi:radical SAM protein with 4Fe4S-binding SPASM domain
MPHVNKRMISFFLTTSCNLACTYCYSVRRIVEQRRQTLGVEFAKAAIDEFFARDTSRHIRFYGPGEPTQEFGLLKEIHAYSCHAAAGRLTSEIQTNGVFGTDVADWLAGNVDIIWVSCDGPPDIQDACRVTVHNEPTSTVLAENVRFLCRNGKGMTGVRATITGVTVRRQMELVDYCASLGVRHIWTDPVFPAVGEGPDRLFDFRLYADEFLRARAYAGQGGVFLGSFLACNFDGDTDRHCRACVPVPHLTTDGYVSACDMALFGKLAPTERHMAQFIYGKWNEEQRRIEYDEYKIRALQARTAKNMRGCRGCPVLSRCAGYCLGEVANETGDMFGRKGAVCEAIKYLYAQMAGTVKPYRYFHP